MKMRTEIPVFPSGKKIDHTAQVYFTGSCFSEHIAEKLRYAGFDVKSNSHGIVYNPLSLEQSIREVVAKKNYTPNELHNEGERFLSFHHHGSFNRATAAETAACMNEAIVTHHDFIRGAGFVFISLGTAWIYARKENHEVVANCHKLDPRHFTKRILSPEEIREALLSMVVTIKALSPGVEVIFTLSPVKHLKDGFTENMYSKSLLHAAIQQVLGTGISYFPAYEIMQDDLRDYRFWSKDMMHPNELAIDYIWEKFSAVYFSAETISVIREVEKTRVFDAHRPLTHNPEEIKALTLEKNKKIETLQQKYPSVKW